MPARPRKWKTWLRDWNWLTKEIEQAATPKPPKVDAKMPPRKAKPKVAEPKESGLSVCCMPCGISYADRGREEHGDYKRVAFLPFRSLELEVADPQSPLLEEAREHAATIQARRGEQFQVSTCGQYITLGR